MPVDVTFDVGVTRRGTVIAAASRSGIDVGGTRNAAVLINTDTRSNTVEVSGVRSSTVQTGDTRSTTVTVGSARRDRGE